MIGQEKNAIIFHTIKKCGLYSATKMARDVLIEHMALEESRSYIV